jgi:hypothetical protein
VRCTVSSVEYPTNQLPFQLTELRHSGGMKTAEQIALAGVIVSGIVATVSVIVALLSSFRSHWNAVWTVRYSDYLQRRAAKELVRRDNRAAVQEAIEAVRFMREYSYDLADQRNSSVCRKSGRGNCTTEYMKRCTC